MGNICASVDKHDSARELHTSPPQQNEKQPSGEAFTTVDDVDFQTIGSEPTTPNSGGDEKPFSCQSIATFQDASGTGKIHLLEGNVMQRTPFEDNIFDYVHQQYLVLGLPEAAWPAVIFELCRVLKPGGYLDLLDGIPVWQGPKGDAAQKFQNSLKAIMASPGFNIHIAASLGRLVSQNGGYEHVRQLRRIAPLGWDGNIGELFLWDFKKGMGNLGPLAAPALGMTVDQWNEMLEETGENYTSSKFRVCARKRLSPPA